MKLQLFIILFFLSPGRFAWSYAVASGCTLCEPLVRVKFTQKGLAGLSEAIVFNVFEEIQKKVRSKIDMKDLVIDKSKCPTLAFDETQDHPEAFSNGCYGVDFSDSDSVTGELNRGMLRPYQLTLSNLRMKNMDLKILDNVDCSQNECLFKIGIENIDFKSRISAQFTDVQKKAIPDGVVTLASEPGKSLVYNFKLSINPESGLLGEAIQISIPKDQALSQEKIFQVNYRPSNSKKISVNENEIYKKQFENLKRSFSSTEWVKSRLFEKSVEVKTQCKSEQRELLKKELLERKTLGVVDENCNSKSNNLEEVSKCMTRQLELYKVCDQQAKIWQSSQVEKEYLNLAFPNYQGPESFGQLSEEILKLPGVEGPLLNAETEVDATAYGVDISNFKALRSGLDVTNKLLNDSEVIKNYINPWIEKSLLPSVISGINQELRQTQKYWDELSKVPNLNFQLLENKNRLGKELAEIDVRLTRVDDDPTYIDSVLKRRAELMAKYNENEEKIKRDQWPVKTRVLISTLSQSNELSMNIYDEDTKCNVTPKVIFEDETQSSDMETTLKLETLDKYLQQMVDQGNLSFCHGSSSENCLGGVQVQIKNKPDLTCDHGRYKLNFNKVDVTKMNVGIQKEVLVDLKNCFGSPCLKLEGGGGGFNSIPLDFILNSFLNKSIDEGLKSADLVKLPIPGVKLKDINTDPITCKTSLGWDFKRQIQNLQSNKR